MLPVLAVPSSSHPVVIWGLKFVTVLDQTPVAQFQPIGVELPNWQSWHTALYKQSLTRGDAFFTNLSIISVAHTSKKREQYNFHYVSDFLCFPFLFLNFQALL